MPQKQKLDGCKNYKSLFFCHLQAEGYEYVEVLDPDYFQGDFIHHHHHHHHHKEQK